MKKSKFHFSLFFTAAAFAGTAFFFSCSKNEDARPVSPVTTHTPGARYMESANVSNAANPYDNVGQLHNQGLDYVVDHRAEWVMDPAGMTEKAKELSANFCCENNCGTPGPDCFSATYATMTDAVNTYQSQGVNAIMDQAGSSDLVAYLHQLVSTMSNYKDSTQVDTLIASIKRIESNVNASSLSPDEKQLFLSAASVARYSTDYWFQEAQRAGGSPWVYHDENYNPIPAGRIHWGHLLGIALSDVAGLVAWGPLGSIVVSSVVGSTY